MRGRGGGDGDGDGDGKGEGNEDGPSPPALVPARVARSLRGRGEISSSLVRRDEGTAGLLSSTSAATGDEGGDDSSEGEWIGDGDCQYWQFCLIASVSDDDRGSHLEEDGLGEEGMLAAW